MRAFTESIVEQAALVWYEALGCIITGRPSNAPSGDDAALAVVAGALAAMLLRFPTPHRLAALRAAGQGP